MNYHIYIRETLTKIASFGQEQDRDVCFDALVDYHNLPEEYFLKQDDTED